MVDHFFSVTGSKEQTELITNTANGLIDTWIDDGEVEYVSQYGTITLHGHYSHDGLSARPREPKDMERSMGCPFLSSIDGRGRTRSVKVNG